MAARQAVGPDGKPLSRLTPRGAGSDEGGGEIGILSLEFQSVSGLAKDYSA